MARPWSTSDFGRAWPCSAVASMRGSGVLALLAVHRKEWSEGEAVRGSREGCGEGSSMGAVGDLNRPELGSEQERG